jgi:excisionase family DNA binding protein
MRRMVTTRDSNDLPKFLTTSEFSRLTHLSVATVKRLCAAGEIAHVVVSDRGDRRIPASEVTRLAVEAEANRGSSQ